MAIQALLQFDPSASSATVICCCFFKCHGHVSGRFCVWVKDLLMWGSSAAFESLRRRDDAWGLLRVPQ
jgi:hypothetical protein